MCGRPSIGYRTIMVIYLALAAGLLTLSVVIRIVRVLLVVILVALIVVAVTGHQPSTVGHLAHLL